MAERTVTLGDKSVEADTLVPADFVVVQLLVDGWTEREARRLGIDLDVGKDRIADKMASDDSLMTFLSSVEYLPFTSENFLSPRQGMVLFLKQAGFNSTESGSMLGIDRAAVLMHERRGVEKLALKLDRDLPKVDPEGASFLHRGLVGGIYVALRDDEVNTTMISGEVKAPLSFNESTVLFLMCAGMTLPQIAEYLEKPVGTIETFRKRAGEKLGGGKKYQLIAKGLDEMINRQKRELEKAS